MSHFLIKSIEQRKISHKNIELNKLTPGVYLKVIYIVFQNNKPVLKNYTGMCVGIFKKGYNTSIRVKNVIDNVHVELSFLIYSPLIVDIKLLSLKRKKFKRAILNYLTNYK